eukprot:CAMPEP_0170176410 /NCGR_PEP_ID=MMETSP0040_2-20121228/9285_1 /TAXON_ID=641309 /ORGANISM="Lotharella oceanica, Strain CCMP622" /LENGTH=364 /DNA_ID=CAMNT_0010418715 /DNA_START=131 /DNA_END=1225 /DNA_ORIENTATION=-
MNLHTSELTPEIYPDDLNLRKVHRLHEDLEDLRFVSKLGRGGFGSVTLVRHKKTGLLYSIKVTDPKEMGGEGLRLNDRINLQHPFIVRMRKSLQIDSGQQLALFDFVRGPELRHLIHSAPSLVRENAPFYLSQLVLALEYLSERGIQHRDLKPENILMCEKGYLKLADFGLAVKSSQQSDHSADKKSFAGTLAYSSPGMILSGYDIAADYWSLGVIAYEMLTSHHPFQGEGEGGSSTSEILMRIVAGPELKFPSSLSVNAQQLIKGLLTHDPVRRKAFFGSIRAHKFFSGVCWNAIEGRRAKAPVIDLSIYREWKDKFILERKNSKIEGELNKEQKRRPPIPLPRKRTIDNKDANEMDTGVLWG